MYLMQIIYIKKNRIIKIVIHYVDELEEQKSHTLSLTIKSSRAGTRGPLSL